MYQYIESGLKNVWLIDGYRVDETPYGSITIVDNEAELVHVIAEALSNNKKDINGDEFRFLRNVMGRTQAELSDIFGKTPVTISRWETEMAIIPKWADRIIRQLCLEHLGKHPRLGDIINKVPTLPSEPSFNFDNHDGHWSSNLAA